MNTDKSVPARSRAGLTARARGFTLIELMIVVAIVAILAVIAYPAYGDYIMRARRTDATRALTEAASAMERYFSQNQRYTSADLAAIYADTSPDGYYALTLNVAGPNAYTITATRQGSQTHDTGCGNFTINQASQRTVSGSLTPKECWKLN